MNGGRARPALSVEHVSKSYGSVRALRDVDLEVFPGEIVGLLGINGAGKTTLLSIVAGLLEPETGHVHVAGEGSGPNRRTTPVVGLVAQELSIWPTLSVEQNLVFVAEATGLAAPRRRAAVDEALDAVRLGDLRSRLARELSGGEKRRLHVALTLIGGHRVLLLDEPTANCDPQSRAQLLALVRDLAASGRALVYSTHYLTEIEDVCERLMILHQGVVMASGRLDGLIDEHGEWAVDVRLRGDAPDLDLGRDVRHLADGTLRVPGVALASDVGDLVQAVERSGAVVDAIEFVRPSLEHVFLSLTGGHRVPAQEG